MSRPSRLALAAAAAVIAGGAAAPASTGAAVAVRAPSFALVVAVVQEGDRLVVRSAGLAGVREGRVITVSCSAPCGVRGRVTTGASYVTALPPLRGARLAAGSTVRLVAAPPLEPGRVGVERALEYRVVRQGRALTLRLLRRDCRRGVARRSVPCPAGTEAAVPGADQSVTRLVAEGRHALVRSASGRQVLQFDPGRGRLVRVLRTGDVIGGVTITGDTAWVTGLQALHRLGLVAGTSSRTASFTRQPFAPGVALYRGRPLLHFAVGMYGVDPRTGDLEEIRPACEAPTGFDVGLRGVAGDRAVIECGQDLAAVDLTGATPPRRLTEIPYRGTDVSGDSLWVGGDPVRRIDVATGAESGFTPRYANGVPLRQPRGIAVHRDRVYLSDSQTDSVYVYTTAGRLLERIPTGYLPADVGVAAGALWVLNRGDETLSRIPLRP